MLAGKLEAPGQSTHVHDTDQDAPSMQIGSNQVFMQQATSTPTKVLTSCISPGKIELRNAGSKQVWISTTFTKAFAT